MTAHLDTDGTGYLIRSVGNVFLGISALTPDFLDTTGICSWGPRVRHSLLFSYASLVSQAGAPGATASQAPTSWPSSDVPANT